MKPPGPVLLAVTLAACACLAGCTAEEESAPVEVVLTAGSPLADAPSAIIVRITSTSSAEEVLATATEAVTVEGEPLVLVDDALPPGKYRLTAAQQGCAMTGRDCPDDPSSSEFGEADWQCSVVFEARRDQGIRVEIAEGLDVNGSCVLAS